MYKLVNLRRLQCLAVPRRRPFRLVRAGKVAIGQAYSVLAFRCRLCSLVLKPREERHLVEPQPNFAPSRAKSQAMFRLRGRATEEAFQIRYQ